MIKVESNKEEGTKDRGMLCVCVCVYSPHGSLKQARKVGIQGKVQHKVR